MVGDDTAGNEENEMNINIISVKIEKGKDIK